MHNGGSVKYTPEPAHLHKLLQINRLAKRHSCAPAVAAGSQAQAGALPLPVECLGDDRPARSSQPSQRLAPLHRPCQLGGKARLLQHAIERERRGHHEHWLHAVGLRGQGQVTLSTPHK